MIDKDVFSPYSIRNKLIQMFNINISTRSKNYRKRIIKKNIEIAGVAFECEIYFIELKEDKVEILPYGIYTEATSETNNNRVMVDLSNLLVDSYFSNKMEEIITEHIEKQPPSNIK